MKKAYGIAVAGTGSVNGVEIVIVCTPGPDAVTVAVGTANALSIELTTRFAYSVNAVMSLVVYVPVVVNCTWVMVVLAPDWVNRKLPIGLLTAGTAFVIPGPMLAADVVPLLSRVDWPKLTVAIKHANRSQAEIKSFFMS